MFEFVEIWRRGRTKQLHPSVEVRKNVDPVSLSCFPGCTAGCDTHLEQRPTALLVIHDKSLVQ